MYIERIVQPIYGLLAHNRTYRPTRKAVPLLVVVVAVEVVVAAVVAFWVATVSDYASLGRRS